MHTVARNAIWRVVGGVDEAALRARRPDGWSVLDVLEHLNLVEARFTAAIEQLLQQPPATEIPPVDLSVALDRTHKLQSPPPARPQSRFASLAEARAALDASRAALNAVIAKARPGALETHAAGHPVLGMASARDWYDFAALHELRHLGQIHQILRG